MGLSSTARSVLERRVPYLSCLLVLKVLALFAVFFLAPGTLGHTGIVLFCVVATVLDIVLRIAASKQHAFSCSKHGTDTLLTVLLLINFAACSTTDDARHCRALKMLIPFAILTSAGGNMMRLTAAPRRPPDGGDVERGESIG